jgi:predicted DCC family thiol-disulfide oxidoreductase YuxK
MRSLPTTLIYDGNCSYCRRFARLIQTFNRKHQLIILTYQTKQAQALLKAQFGSDIGFTMYLFDQDQVYWAQAAARQVVDVLGWPRWMAAVAYKIYPTIVTTVSRLTRRAQQVCLPGQGACGTSLMSSGHMPINQSVFELSVEIPSVT